MRLWPIIDIRGDKQKCLEYLAYGKSLLARMNNYMNANKLQQSAWWGYPAPGVAVLAERRMAVSRIFIDIAGGAYRKFIKKLKFYWYHIITGGYRWYINDLCVDNTGMIYLIGGQSETNPAIWFGDWAFIARYTPEGVLTYTKRWDKTAGFVEDTDWCFGQSIVSGEPGYIYMLVDYARIEASGIYETMLVKLTSGGEIIWDIGIGDSSNWTQTYANNVQYHYEIIADVRYDYVYTIVEFRDFAPVSGGTISMMLLTKTDSDGTVLWKKFARFAFDTSPHWVRADDLSVDNNGNSYCLVRTDNDGVTIWLGDFTVIKFNSSGADQWQKMFGPTTRTGDIFTVAHEIVADDFGNIYVLMLEKERTGASTGYMKTVLINLASDGSVQWARKYQVAYSNNENPYNEVWPRLAQGHGGDIYVLSNALDDSVADDDDYILAKFNSDGDNIWLQMIHGVEWGVNIGGFAIDPNGDIVIGADVYSQDRSFTLKIPDGPLNGTFHNLNFSTTGHVVTSHSITGADETDIIIETATDMDIMSVDYITSTLATETETLYKFLETEITEEVYDAN